MSRLLGMSSLLVALLGGPTLTSSAVAQVHAAPQSVGDLLARADLAFHGEVVRVEYVNSLPSEEAPGGIPHTFVTYRVERVLFGQDVAEEVTLRFFGGYDADSQTFLAASVSPRFDVGDEDVLFVAGNGTLACPLVGNAHGRFRIIAGQVYTESGNTVSLEADGTVRTGAGYDLEPISTTLVNGEVFLVSHRPLALRGPSPAMPGDALVAAVALEGLAAPAPRAAFRSLDAARHFESRFPAPAPLRDRLPADLREADGDALDHSPDR